MNDALLSKIERIQVVSVLPDDVIIVKFPDSISAESAQDLVDRLRPLLKEEFPDNRVLFFSAGIEITVTGKAVSTWHA